MRGKLLILFAALAAAAAVGSVGYAAIPSADGTISACRDGQGRLKVIDAEAGATCSSGQQAMKWNQQGPQGPVGPQGPRGITGLQGPAGPAGPQGSPGPVSVYYGHDSSGGIMPYEYATIGGRLDLPAGQWLLIAKVQGAGIFDDGGKAWLDCRLHANESVRDSSEEILDDWYPQTLTLIGIHSASTPFEAGVRCRDRGKDAYWDNVKITAMPVTQLHNVAL
jgi:hypothetical protein